jgi:hypothetical protein
MKELISFAYAFMTMLMSNEMTWTDRQLSGRGNTKTTGWKRHP